jgi:carbon storage regulator
MLIIGRRAGESIFLGEDVEVKIMDITPSRVKLGIVAPKQLGILRGEIVQAESQNLAAAQVVRSASVEQVLHHLRGAIRTPADPEPKPIL